MLLTKLAQLAQHVADQQPPLLEHGDVELVAPTEHVTEAAPVAEDA